MRKTIALIPMIIFLSGCGPELLCGPTDTPAPANTPLPTPATAEASGLKKNGAHWHGSTDTQLDIDFTIRDDQIVSFLIQDFVTTQCDIRSATGNGREFNRPVKIENGFFEFNMYVFATWNGDAAFPESVTAAKLHITGKFLDAGRAEGDIQQDDSCGKSNFRWTAEPEE